MSFIKLQGWTGVLCSDVGLKFIRIVIFCCCCRYGWNCKHSHTKPSHTNKKQMAGWQTAIQPANITKHNDIFTCRLWSNIDSLLSSSYLHLVNKCLNRQVKYLNPLNHQSAWPLACPFIHSSFLLQHWPNCLLTKHCRALFNCTLCTNTNILQPVCVNPSYESHRAKKEHQREWKETHQCTSP